jgi:hypothetical protein
LVGVEERVAVILGWFWEVRRVRVVRRAGVVPSGVDGRRGSEAVRLYEPLRELKGETWKSLGQVCLKVGWWVL